MRLKSLTDSTLREVINGSGETRYIHDYYGGSAGPVPDPQGFLVEMPAQNTGRAHFHGVDQFQVFFGSPGAVYQRHPMSPVMVHYSDAFSVYGPFNTEAHPIEFFTLRAKSDNITAYMPESREKLKEFRAVQKRGRNVHKEVPASADGKALPAGSTHVEVLIKPQADGMAAYMLRGGPGAGLTGPDPRGSNGQYYCVVGGAVLQDGRALGPKSLGWVSPDEPAPALVAGEETGFEVLVMQYPRKPLG
jgi:hypothetical protein